MVVTAHKLLEDYDAGRLHFEEFADALERLISEILRDRRIHSVSARVKDRDSISRKIQSKPGKYESIGDITDIVGVRVVTYFTDEVDYVADVVKSEFEIDLANSVDKREIEIDRFGYQSLHYVLRLDERRRALSELSQFAGISAELQIRTVLQHAWAEIEHDLGYKSSIDLPRQLKSDRSAICSDGLAMVGVRQGTPRQAWKPLIATRHLHLLFDLSARSAFAGQ